jgi:hypothetical protein
VAFWPRLLTLPRLAEYLSVGPDIARELARTTFRGARVELQAPTTGKRKGGKINRVLLDRVVIDQLVSSWRETP